MSRVPSKSALISLLALFVGLAAPARALEAALETKIEAAERRMDSASEALARRMSQDGAPYSRAEWEQLLAPSQDERLSADDLAAIRADHRRRIRASREASRKASLLDLDLLRARPELVERFCRELPKGGMLHIHPWGTLDRETALRILDRVDPEMNLTKLRAELYSPASPGAFAPGELDFLNPYGASVRYSELPPADREGVLGLFFLPEGPQDFRRFMGVFTYLSALVFANKNVDPEPMMWDAFLARARALNVDYVEVTQNVKPWASWMEGLEEWAADRESEHGVTIRLLGAFNRQGDPERNLKAVRKLLELPSSPVLTGINLLADESEQPALESGQRIYGTLLAARARGDSSLRMTMHAGELGDVRNLRDAMILGAERVGHGVKLAQDPLALEIARRRGLGVETNLVSNLRLKVAGDIASHPFVDYLRLGLKVSLSTDDEGMFESDITDECELAVRETDISYDELKRMSLFAIESAFAEESLKSALRKALERKLREFEKRWDALATL